MEEKVAQHVGDIKAMMGNLKEAILIIDESDSGAVCVAEERSSYAKVIFSSLRTEERVMITSVLDELLLSAEEKTNLLSVIIGSLNEDPFAFDVNEDKYPRYSQTASGRSVEITLSPISTKGVVVDRILWTVSDITEKLKAKAQAEKVGRQQSVTMEILSLPLFRAQRNLNALRQALNLCHDKNDMQSVMRTLHTCKGLARTFQYTMMSEEIHILEDNVLEASKFPDQGIACADKIVAEYEEVYHSKLSGSLTRNEHSSLDKWQKFWRSRAEEVFRPSFPAENLKANLDECFSTPISGEFISDILELFASEMNRIANMLSKPLPRLQVIGDVPLTLEEEDAALLQGILTHLIRNSLDHGLEFAGERQAKGKDISGTITLEVISADPKGLHFNFYDDGRGLNREAVIQRAKKLLLPHETNEEIGKVIFASGVSTKETTSIVSGRGVGLDAILDATLMRGGFVKAILAEEIVGSFQRIQFEVMLVFKGCQRLVKT